MTEQTEPAFFDYCNQLQADWLDQKLETGPLVEACFQLNYLPEPYLFLENGNDPLCVLATNLARGMDFQKRKVIQSGDSFLSAAESYSVNSAKLVQHYGKRLTKQAALRIRNLQKLKTLAGKHGLLQVQSCPLRSTSFPNRANYVQSLNKEALLQNYTDALREYLSSRTTIVFSPITTRGDINVERITEHTWLSWQAELIGFDPEQCQRIELARNPKNDRTSSAFIYSSDGKSTKGFLLMSGGNQVPTTFQLSKIGGALKTA